MKLYYSPGACSMASHIVAKELELEVKPIKVDLRTHLTENGGDYYLINPKGYVPALEIAEGKILTEGVAILMYLADQKPEKGLNPSGEGMEKYHFQELMTFISSELHKGMSQFFAKSNYTEEGFAMHLEKLHKRLAYLDSRLTKQEFLSGNSFTVADAYAYTVLNWRHMFQFDISQHKNLTMYLEKLAQRPSIVMTLEAESGK